MEKLNTYIMGTTFQTNLLINALALKFPISGVITLKQESVRHSVSGYSNLKDVTDSYALELYEVSDYSLNCLADKDLIEKLEIDILIVFGWQRLIPKWLLSRVRLAAVGVHGSPDGITKGRGRSPQNWSLILGANEFSFSLFELSDGIDSGKIISSSFYEISAIDDIASIYGKLTSKSIDLISDFLSNPQEQLASAKNQGEEPTYYPKRIEADGSIDWNRGSKEILNLIRAVTKPYPGAFTFSKQGKIRVWKAHEIQFTNANSNFSSGEIVWKSPSGELCVATGDGFIMINEYDLDGSIEVGDKLQSPSLREVIGAIIKRHNESYPDQPISERLLEYWRSLNE